MDVESILRKLEPLLPRDVRRWRASLPLVDAKVRNSLERHIIVTAQRLLPGLGKRLLLPLPPGRRGSGELVLGTIIYEGMRLPFGLNREEVMQGVGIYGRSGAGKTNVVFRLLLELERVGVPFLFLDWKRTCRHLLPQFSRRVNFYTPGRDVSPMHFNPFIPPPGMERHRHLDLLVDMLGTAYTLGDGAKSLLQRILHPELRDEGSTRLADVLQALEQMPVKGREAGWRVSAERAVRSLSLAGLFAGTGETQASMAEKFLEQSTVVELDGLNTNAKKFLIPILVTWIYHHGLQRPEREKLSLVIVVEEAHHVMYQQDRQSQELVMNRLVRQCRELGIGMVIVDQHPSKISRAALGNTFASICLNLRDPSDVSKAAALSSVGEDEKRFLSQLPVGEGVVKLQDRWRQPFLVKFPLVHVRKGDVADERLRSLLASRTAGAGRGGALRARRRQVRRVPDVDIRLDADAFRLLGDCIGHPEDGVKVRYQRLGVSVDKGNRLRRELSAAGLLEEARLNLGMTRKVVLRASAKGWDLASGSPGPRQGARHESIEHEHWKREVAERYRKAGYSVRLEAPRASGGHVDVEALRAGERIAVEVETGASDVVSNVRQDLLDGFNRVIVVPTSERARNKVERELGRAGLLIVERLAVDGRAGG